MVIIWSGGLKSAVTTKAEFDTFGLRVYSNVSVKGPGLVVQTVSYSTSQSEAVIGLPTRYICIWNSV